MEFIMNVTSQKFEKEFVTKWANSEDSDKCSHVEADPSVAHTVHTEDDSFGPLVRHVVCKTCHEAIMESAEDECTDCNGTFKLTDLTEWNVWDDDAGVTHEHLLCEECKNAPKHQARVARIQAQVEADEAREREEMEYRQMEEEERRREQKEREEYVTPFTDVDADTVTPTTRTQKITAELAGGGPEDITIYQFRGNDILKFYVHEELLLNNGALIGTYVETVEGKFRVMYELDSEEYHHRMYTEQLPRILDLAKDDLDFKYLTKKDFDIYYKLNYPDESY